VRALLLAGAFLACSASAALAATPPAAATPAPVDAPTSSAAADPCPMRTIADVDRISMEDSLSHPIDDPEALKLIRQIVLVPVKNQFGALAAILKSGDVTPNPVVVAAVAKQCLGKEVAFQTVRALALVLNIWDKSNVIGDRTDKLTAIVQNGLAAVAVRDAVPKEIVSAALAPFATLPSVPGPSPAPVVIPCSDHGPSAVEMHQLDYPESSSLRKQSGTVKVSVLLDAHGYVRSVSEVKAAADAPPVDSDLVDTALFAAAASVYAPATVGCKPAPSRIIVSETFEIDK
jgi:hypothetical protein